MKTKGLFKNLYKQEAKGGLYQIFPPLLTCGRSMLRYFSHSYGEAWVFVRKNYLHIYLSEENMEKVAQEFLEKAGLAFPPHWEHTWRRIDRQLTKSAFTISQSDLKKMSNEKLWQWYQKVFKQDETMWAISIFIDVFDASYDQKEILRRAEIYSLASEEVSILLAPTVPSYIAEWEHALNLWKQKRLSLKALKNKFFWYATDYADYGEVDADFVHQSVSHAHRLEKSDILKKERQILSRHQLKKNPLLTFRILSHWRDDRKRLNFTGLYALLSLLREGLRRQNIPEELVNGLIADEARDVFLGTIDGTILKRRIQEGVLVQLKNNGSISITDGENARSMFKQLELAVAPKEQAEIKGMVACKGRVTAHARVILDVHSPQASAMKPGDILVTSMTRPEFLPLMKIAGAIVTNEGGISCHAAIVARELKKPCIIGTKIATQVLKDGDLVEVNANNGIVRIVERSEEERGHEAAKREVFDALDGHIFLPEAGREMYPYIQYICHYQYWREDKDWPVDTIKVVAMSKNRLVKWFFVVRSNNEFFPYLDRFVKDTTRLKKLKFYILKTRRETVSHLKKLSSRISQKNLIELAEFFYNQSASLLRAAGTARYTDRALLLRFRSLFEKGGQADEMIRILATPLVPTFSLAEEMALLKLADMLKRRKLSVRSVTAHTLIKKIHNKYAWTGMGYGTEQPRTLKEYEASVKEMMRQDPKTVLNELQVKRKHDLALREKTIQRLDRQTCGLANIAAEISSLKDLFKFSINEIIYRGEALFDAMAKRTGRSKEYLKDLMQEDTLALLRGETINEKRAQERLHKNVTVSLGINKFVILEGQAVNEFEEQFLKLENNGQTEFRGRVASPGLVRGRVKVVLSPADFSKFKAGDILVATNTSPDFVILVKKAAAIVAEEGGITAHVSVVSREFGIPCIVGLNHITQILKDGDLVEVDAENGVVRVLK